MSRSSHVLSFCSQGMYSCCNFEDETAPAGTQATLPQYHHVSTVPPPPPPHVIATGVGNTSIAMTTAQQQQQQQQQKHHQQQQQQQQPQPVYNALIPGTPPATVHSGMALGPSNSPILGAPMPCQTFLPRHDRRLAVVDRWTRPKAGPEKSIAISSGITELTQFPQGMAPHWAGGERSLDEYKRYYGPIDPEGLGASAEPQTATAQTPKSAQRGTKSSGNPRLPPKVPPPKLALHGSPPRPGSFWRRSSLSKRKGSGGPLYENILPLGRRGGGGRNGLREGGARRGRRPPQIPLPVPVPLSSPTQTPPSPSPSLCYTTSASTSSSSSSSSSSESLSRSNSPSSSSSYTSSQSFRYRGGAVMRDIFEDYDTDELTEESSLLLGRRKGRSRSRMSSRSLPCSPPPPPIPPRKPRQLRENGRDRTSSQLAQLQEWWASWGEKERGRRTAEREEDREEKRHHKERERERKRRKKGRKKKKREERERERERKRRKAKKKKKKEEKRRERERRPEQAEGLIDRKEEYEKRMSQDYSYPVLRRSSFRKKSESSSRSYDWDIPREDMRREREDARGADGDDVRGRERHRSPPSHHSRQRTEGKRYPSASKPTTAVKFWGSGNPTHAPSSSSLLPLLPLSSKRRKSIGSDREGRGRGGESRPLLGRNGRSRARSREGISLHEWDSDEEDEEDESEVEGRARGEDRGRRRDGRGMESESERSRDREKTIEIYTDDEGSSGEFGKFERYWEGHEERAVGGIGGGGWFFGTYPAREKGGSINSRDDSFVGWGQAESGWAFGSSSNQWPPQPLTPPPPRRYWSVDKLPVKSEKKGKNRSQDSSRGHTACSCHSPHHLGKSHSKWSRVTSRSQEDLHPHCPGGSSASTRPKHQAPKPDRAQGQAKSGSQSNLSVQRPPRSDRSTRQPSPPQALITPLMPPSLPALPPPPSSSHPIHVPPPTSSSSVSSPSVVSSTPGAPQPSSMSSSSAKLQYQRLRSAPQRFQSPHLPLKTKSLCSRRGSAHFSSVESEV